MTESRFLGFCTPPMLDTLVSCTDWYVDATFGVVPDSFYQLHGVRDGFNHTGCAFLMTGKSNSDYKLALGALKESRPAIRPETVMKAWNNAFSAMAGQNLKSVWRLVGGLKKEAAVAKMDGTQELGG